MKLPVTVTVNGRAIQREVEPRLLLVHFLRDVAGLTGTKVGCDTSQCGACTVLLDGQPTRACVTPAGAAAGKPVRTLEALAPAAGRHPLQQAFIDEQAAQCGYCLNGIIMAAAALLAARPDPSDGEIREALAGHLCRCGVHLRIIRAIKRAARAVRTAG
jgi:aerobic-type carbon monoxide dehydrogenase small subunit (CoxS/CutS family)